MIIEKRKGRYLVFECGRLMGIFGSMREAGRYIWRMKAPKRQAALDL